MEEPRTAHKATVVSNGSGHNKKTIPAIVAAVIALVFLSGTVYYLHSHTVGDAPVSELAPAMVQITHEGFSPATVKLKKDQQLTWTNADSVSHRITGADKDIAELHPDQAIAPQDSLTATMEHGGTFTYYDSLSNTSFKGTIIVE